MPARPWEWVEVEDRSGEADAWLRDTGAKPGHVALIRPDKFVYALTDPGLTRAAVADARRPAGSRPDRTKDQVMNVSARSIYTHAHIRARRDRAGRLSLQSDTQADRISAVILGTRSRILEVAVQLYRRLGHRKTTVIDIAHEISMSPANCYRFFRSKQAIKEAVVGRLFEQVIVAAVDAARSAGSATGRLEAVLQEVERLNKSRFREERTLHDLVVIALRENWTSVRAYSERLEAVVVQIVADGQVHGEFRDGDPMTVARCLLAATDFCTNPLLIGANASYARPTSDRMLEFCVRGLREV